VLEVSGGTYQRVFPGNARARTESRLSFRVAGSIEALPVTVGQEVDAGDLIARLDDSDYDLMLAEARAARSQVRAQERAARSQYERVSEAYEAGVSSISELDAARANLDSASASLRAASQRVQMAEEQVGYCTLSAPTSGEIAAVLVEENEVVNAGNPVVVLASAGDIPREVALEIPEAVRAEVEAGDPVSVTFTNLPGRLFAGRITEVGVTSSRTGTFPVTVLLDNPAPEIVPGYSAEVTFTFGDETQEPGLHVPAHTVAEDAQRQRFVYLVEPAEDEPGMGVVHRRDVTTGALTPRGFEILDGLEGGERLVTAGMRSLRDGARVELLTEPESTAAAPETAEPPAAP
jgi:RND family efflux transporter MFP subunit